MGSTSKRQKLSKEVKLKEAEDRISNLPKGIISHILSFLPTKHAVGTSILSTKWKHMWTSISNLDFDDWLFLHAASDQCEMSFIKFVYRVLLLLEGSNVNKVHIRCSRFSDASHVNAWVTAALSRNVRELDIYFLFQRSGLLPSDLFTCNQLVVLKLGYGFVLNIPRLVCLQSLKTLHLRSGEFRDEESAKRLFSSCPVLEDLVLQECGGKNVSVLSISAPALKSLFISYPVPKSWKRSCEFLGYITSNFCKYRIELNTPNLLHLEYGGLVAEGYAIKNLSSLVKAHIDFVICGEQYKDYYQTFMTELVQGISTVHTLYISGACMETLWLSYYNELPMFHNLTSLKLGNNRSVRWELLPELLESSPNLRTLVFEEGLLDNDSDSYQSDPWDWNPPEHVPTCLLFHLEIIDIGNFQGQQCELSLVKYFLNNAKVLKTMKICYVESQMCEEESKVSRKLLKMPRGSTNCEVVVSS